MTGEELRQLIKRSGMSITDVAREMGTSPQNLGAKLNRKSIKYDFIQTVQKIIDKCCPPLPAEMEMSVSGSAINGSNSPNVLQNVNADASLLAQNKMLIDQNRMLLEQNNMYLEQIKSLNETIKILANAAS